MLCKTMYVLRSNVFSCSVLVQNIQCTAEELKELVENLEEGQILEVTFDAE